MTLNDQAEADTDRTLPICPNCGAAGSLRPVAAHRNARMRTTNNESRCIACNVVIVHASAAPPAAE